MANEIRRIQNDGKLVPSGIVIDLLKSRIVNNPGLHLVDGFPRNFENIDLWNKKMMKFCDV
jgi:adenylate kinase family enzyme